MDNDDSENMFAGAVAGMIAETIMHPFDTLNTRLKVFSDAGGSSGDNAGAGKGAQSGTGSIRIAGTRGMPSTVLRYSVPRSAVMQFFPAHSMSFHSGTMIGAMYRIVSLEGWRALYAGVPATLIGAIPSTALYFSAYEAAKRFGEASYNDFADAAQAATGVRPDNEMVYLPAVYFTAGAFGELASSSVYVAGSNPLIFQSRCCCFGFWFFLLLLRISPTNLCRRVISLFFARGLGTSRSKS